jgi:hypothetical protein
MRGSDVVQVHFRVDGGHEQVCCGRFAQTLFALVENGERGVSSLACQGIRLGHYVFILRREHGVKIDTEREAHGGVCPGTHGRSRLSSTVEILKTIRAGETNGKRRSRRGKSGESRNAA